jgi:hypothetical protein
VGVVRRRLHDVGERRAREATLHRIQQRMRL